MIDKWLDVLQGLENECNALIQAKMPEVDKAIKNAKMIDSETILLLRQAGHYRMTARKRMAEIQKFKEKRNGI